MISLDISTLSEPLRWAFTLIGGMPYDTFLSPVLKNSDDSDGKKGKRGLFGGKAKC